MRKKRSPVAKRKLKISKELLSALETAELPDDIVEQIISILLRAQEAKGKEKRPKDGVLNSKTNLSAQEMLVNTYNRLDGLIDRTEDIKSRVDAISLELQKLTSIN